MITAPSLCLSGETGETYTAMKVPREGVEVSYARRACNTQAEWKAAEIRIRAERKAGKLLKEIEKSKGGRPEKNSPKGERHRDW